MTYIKTKLKKEIIVSHIVTIHYFEYMKDFVFHGESHNFWEMLYVDKGQVMVQADDRQYELKTGDIIFHKPDEFHAIRSIGSQAPNLVAISFCTSSAAMKQFCRQCFAISLEERMLISQVIREARLAFSTPLHIPSVEQVQKTQNAPFGAQQLVLLYLELFLVMLKRNHLDSALQGQTGVLVVPQKNPMTKTQHLEAILQYLESRICEQVRIEEVCGAFSLSRSALLGLFHSTKGCGVIDCFNQMKIDRAKEIIRDSSMNFTEISHYLSYSSLQYFSRQFKKATGMSPAAYKSSVKGISRLSDQIRKETVL